jgi:hypothetical protein
MNDVGETYFWTNARSCQSGELGNGLNVAWRQAFYKGDTEQNGPTMRGTEDFITPTETYHRDRIFFARIFGEPQEFGLLGRQDYTFMQHTKLPDGSHQFDMNVWKNIGWGGTKLAADGNKYCNMMGHSNGAMVSLYSSVSSKKDLELGFA